MKTLLQIFDLVMENQLWPDKKPSEVLMILMFLHNKGWIYTTTLGGKITSAICAYRIKEVTDESLVRVPANEEGTILYSLFCVSLTKDNSYRTIREALNLYLKENPDVTELVLKDMDSKIKRYNLKGASNGQDQRAFATADTNVSN